MNDYAVAQLAEIRRQELIADAMTYRAARRQRTRTSTRSVRHGRQPITAFYAWLAAGQL